MKNHTQSTRREAYVAYQSYSRHFALLAQEFVQEVIFHFSRNCDDYTHRKELVGTKQLLMHGAIFRDKKGDYHATRKEMELSNELIDLRMLYKSSQNDLMMAKRTIRSQNEQIGNLNETIDILQLPDPQPKATLRRIEIVKDAVIVTETPLLSA